MYFKMSLDKFYTTSETVIECITLLKSTLLIKDTDLIIEPSAGNGAFIKAIESLSNNYKFYDIAPEHPDILEQDFLSLTLTSQGPVHFIGNPPFGKQSSLAIKFIKKATSYINTTSISFILPKSFRKDSMQKHFPLSFHLEAEIDLSSNIFLVENKPHNVPCIFQIWVKKDFERKAITKLETNDFTFVKKNESPDISFRRVGVYAGKIDKEIASKSEESHYFIRFHNPEALMKLEALTFEFNNTVGPKSISKQEIIKAYMI
jgi:hypothetical protein